MKAARLGEDKIFIFYEIWSPNSYKRSEYMVINVDGDILTEPTEMPYPLRLCPTDIVEVTDDEFIVFYGGDGSVMTRYHLSLNRDTDEPSMNPTVTLLPSMDPSILPSITPSKSMVPSAYPSSIPSQVPIPMYTFTPYVPVRTKTIWSRSTTVCDFENDFIVAESDQYYNLGIITGKYSGSCYPWGGK